MCELLGREAGDRIRDSQLRADGLVWREGERRRGHYGWSWRERGEGRMAYGFSLFLSFSVSLLNFRAVTLRIKGWVSVRTVRSSTWPESSLEQPPFVQGITSAKEEKKYFNARTPPYRPTHQKRKMEVSKITNRSVDIAKDEQ